MNKSWLLMKCVVFIVAAALSRSIYAFGYSITNIVDSLKEFAAFSFVDCNDNGEVVYLAVPADRHRPHGIYTGTGSLVIQAGSKFTLLSRPAMNNSGKVVFGAYTDNVGAFYDGIYTGDGTLVVQPSSIGKDALGSPKLNNNGTIVYMGSTLCNNWFPNCKAGIYRNQGELLVERQWSLLSTSNPSAHLVGPAINDHGTVVYWATNKYGSAGIYTDSGRLVVDDSGDIAPVAQPPDINNNGTVAYWAINKGTNTLGVYTDSAKLVIEKAEFANMNRTSVVISNTGKVAFGVGSGGIGPGGVGPSGIGSGDIHRIYAGDGTVVVDNLGRFARFRDICIDDKDQIVFHAELDDGTSGIYVASPRTSPAVNPAIWLPLLLD
jgi:hypothetical protein